MQKLIMIMHSMHAEWVTQHKCHAPPHCDISVTQCHIVIHSVYSSMQYLLVHGYILILYIDTINFIYVLRSAE